MTQNVGERIDTVLVTVICFFIRGLARIVQFWERLDVTKMRPWMVYAGCILWLLAYSALMIVTYPGGLK